MFQFYDPGALVDGELELVLAATHAGNPAAGLVPNYHFNMIVDDQEAGYIALRIGNIPSIVLYAGHIGYRVQPEFRGHHYAARSCKLVLPLAHRHDLNPLWITCNPDNFASRRTCELAGATLVEIVDLPVDNDMYLRGERQKCRYRIDL